LQIRLVVSVVTDFLRRKIDVEIDHKILFEYEPAHDDNVIKINESFSIAGLELHAWAGKHASCYYSWRQFCVET